MVDKAVASAHERKQKETQRKAARVERSGSKYEKLTSAKRKEVLGLIQSFHASLADYANTNNLNPADVSQFAVNADLISQNPNSWKSFQLLSGMVRNKCKLIRIMLWN